MKDSDLIELDTSPLDAPAPPNHSMPSGGTSSSSDTCPGSANATDGPPAPARSESLDSELVAGNVVEETLPDGRKVQGTVVYRTGDLCCVAVDDEWHKGVKRSDLRVIR